MSDTTAQRLLQEAEFIDRYTQYYRRQLTQAMRSMKPEADGARSASRIPAAAPFGT